MERPGYKKAGRIFLIQLQLDDVSQIQSFDFIFESFAMDTQALGRLGLVPLLLFENLDEKSPLEGIQRFLQKVFALESFQLLQLEQLVFEGDIDEADHFLA